MRSWTPPTSRSSFMPPSSVARRTSAIFHAAGSTPSGSPPANLRRASRSRPPSTTLDSAGGPDVWALAGKRSTHWRRASSCSGRGTFGLFERELIERRLERLHPFRGKRHRRSARLAQALEDRLRGDAAGPSTERSARIVAIELSPQNEGDLLEEILAMRPVPDDRADERAHPALFGQEKRQEALLSGVSVQIPMIRDHPGTFPLGARSGQKK